jgi:hypothetical protein
MGLLDDAIREHLELKRLRGADPSEVARDERAALGPPDDAVADETSAIDFDEEELDPDEEPSAGGTGGETGRSPDASHPRSSEETMEVDMRTIIDADLDAGDSDLELHGEAMSTSAVSSGAMAAGRAAGAAEDQPDPDTADAEPSGKRRWRTSRPVRALGLGGSPSAEGSVS